MKSTRKIHRKITKKMKNKSAQTKKRSLSNNKITINIDFSAKDGGFHSLANEKVFHFLMKNIRKGRNLIQCVPGKSFYADRPTKLHLQAVKYSDFSLRPEWNEIECKSNGRWLKSSPCKIGSSDKVFVRYRPVKKGTQTTFLNKTAGFASYIHAIMSGEIDEKKHVKFSKLLRQTMKKNPITVHNMDVDWFHLKSI